MHRTAVVTGVSQGLGLAVLEALAGAGWDVVGVSRSPVEVMESRIRHVRGDVSESTTADAVKQVLAGRPVDLLVNNAVAGSKQHRLADVDADELARALAVNVVAPLRITQALLPGLLAAPRPLVLNVSSRLGSLAMQARDDFRGSVTSYAYRVSKAALNMLTISLAAELGEQIRCWAVHPGVLAVPADRPGATRTPAEAAAQLIELVDSEDDRSLRFCSLGEADLPW